MPVFLLLWNIARLINAIATIASYRLLRNRKKVKNSFLRGFRYNLVSLTNPLSLRYIFLLGMFLLSFWLNSFNVRDVVSKLVIDWLQRRPTPEDDEQMIALFCMHSRTVFLNHYVTIHVDFLSFFFSLSCTCYNFKDRILSQAQVRLPWPNVNVYKIFK